MKYSYWIHPPLTRKSGVSPVTELVLWNQRQATPEARSATPSCPGAWSTTGGQDSRTYWSRSTEVKLEGSGWFDESHLHGDSFWCTHVGVTLTLEPDGVPRFGNLESFDEDRGPLKWSYMWVWCRPQGCMEFCEANFVVEIGKSGPYQNFWSCPLKSVLSAPSCTEVSSVCF